MPDEGTPAEARPYRYYCAVCHRTDATPHRHSSGATSGRPGGGGEYAALWDTAFDSLRAVGIDITTAAAGATSVAGALLALRASASPADTDEGGAPAGPDAHPDLRPTSGRAADTHDPAGRDAEPPERVAPGDEGRTGLHEGGAVPYSDDNPPRDRDWHSHPCVVANRDPHGIHHPHPEWERGHTHPGYGPAR